MLLLILIFQIGGFTLALALASLAIYDKKPSQSKKLLAAFSICLAAGFLMPLPPEWGGSRILRLTSRFINLPTTGLMWWFLLSLLDDKFSIKKIAWAGMLVTIVPAFIFWLEDVGSNALLFPGIYYLNPIIFTLVVLHIVWISISGLKDDMINLRREVRFWIVGLTIIAFAIDVAMGYTLDGNIKYLLRGGITFFSLLLALFWLVRFQTPVLEFKQVTSSSTALSTIDPKDTAAYARLIEIMTVQKAYLDPSLSITSLAGQLNIPTHQLRSLINQGLGFRNFSSFLASYRISDIKLELTDPEKQRIPILSIALNAGFSSITTFNRAFKNVTGKTASEFRRQALKNTVQL